MAREANGEGCYPDPNKKGLKQKIKFICPFFVACSPPPFFSAIPRHMAGSILHMFSGAPPAVDGNAKPLMVSKSKKSASNAGSAAHPPVARRAQKTYEPPPAEREEEEEEPEEEESCRDVMADMRIESLERLKEDYTRVYAAQISTLEEIEKTISKKSPETSDGDPRIDENVSKIQQQRAAITQQYVDLMVRCTAMASDYGRFSPAPILPEARNHGDGTSSKPQARVQPYIYQPQTPASVPTVTVRQKAPSHTYVAASPPSVIAPKQQPAPAYVPAAPATPDMSVYESRTPQYPPGAPTAAPLV